MKHRFLPILAAALLFPFGGHARTQADTLRVSDIFTTHIIFNTDLIYADLSNSQACAAKILEQSKNMMALKARGVQQVYVVDIMDKRLEKAMELGATGVINGKKEDVVAKVMELTGGEGTDLVIETAGSEFTCRQAIQMAGKGSTIVLVGYSRTGEMTLPTDIILNKELTLKSIFRYRHIYPTAIEAVASGKINLKGIVSDIFPLSDIQHAMDESVRNKADIVKAVIKIEE